MDILQTIVVLVPSVLSLCVSGIYAYIALKKAKEPPKDEAWETATRLLSGKSGANADDFAELYLQLKFVKDFPEAMDGHLMVQEAMDARKEKLQQQQFGSASKPR